MKINTKTLTGMQHTIECELDESVASFRDKVRTAFGLAPDSNIRLAFSGAVLSDEKTIGESKITESSTVIVVVSKAKRPAPPPETASAPEKKPEPEPEPKKDEPAPAPEPVSQPPSASTLTEPSAAPVPVVPVSAPEVEISQDAVDQLVAMGFSSDNARQALTMAHGNVQMAANLLVSSGDDMGDMEGGDFGEDEGGMPGGDFSAEEQELIREILAHPDIIEAFVAMARNPGISQTILPIIAQGHPDLFQKIRQHPHVVSAVLSSLASSMAHAPGDDADEGDEGEDSGDDADFGHDHGHDHGHGHPHFHPPAQQPVDLGLTEEDNAAIAHLMDMGFSREASVQAYIACDKNLQLAANLLFDSGGLF